MSAGAFVRSIYETNGGDFARIRVQPETTLASAAGTPNDDGAGPVNLPVSAKVSRGSREIGILPRRIGIAFQIGQAPTGYREDSVYYLPALTRAFFDACVIDQELTYLGSSAVIVSKLEENIK
jgi:hypothetical protein